MTTESTTAAPRGFLRLRQIIGPDGPIPVSRSCWFSWVRSGRAPQPIKLTERATAWRIEDIEAFIEKLSKGTEQ